MKLWLPLIVALVIVVACAAAVHSHNKSVAHKKREIGYRAAVQKYTEDPKPGSRRTDVENYLRARSASFSSIYGTFGETHHSQYADVVKIGEEAAPWYCSEAYVYVAFEFSGVEKYKQNDSDLLEKIEIFRPYSGCL